MKKKYNGAVFFDYDGTLTDDQAGISRPTEATRRAVAQLRKNGYLAILATGRAIPYVYEMGIEFDGMVTSNGTYAQVGEQVIFDCPIEQSLMERLGARLSEMGIPYGIDHPVQCITPDVDNEVFLHWRHTFSIRDESYRAVLPNERVKGYKLSVLYDTQEHLEALREEFGEYLTFDCMRSYKCADANRRGFNKSSGVKAICEYFDLPRKNTYAFGDSMNDLEMIRYVGHGVAMGEHAEEVGKSAEFITKRVGEEGIEYGLKHYGLI